MMVYRKNDEGKKDDSISTTNETMNGDGTQSNATDTMIRRTYDEALWMISAKGDALNDALDGASYVSFLMSRTSKDGRDVGIT